MGVVGGHHSGSGLAGQIRQSPVALNVALHQVLLQLDKHIGRTEPVQVLAKLGGGLVHTACRQKAGEAPLAAAGEQDQALGMFG